MTDAGGEPDKPLPADEPSARGESAPPARSRRTCAEAPAPPAPVPPAPPQFPVPPAGKSKAGSGKDKEYEKKLIELERRLQEEREKVLLANLRTHQEAETAARVELSIKELQDRLRREQRDAEQEQSKRKLQAELKEKEERLNQERETWVAALKGQMQTRQSPDKDVEAHFSLRLQEMERRALEDRAQWQRLTLAKDDEIRSLRSLAEKLKGADAQLGKAVAEKKALEARVSELLQERSEVSARSRAADEKEKESIQLRADLTISREQLSMAQARWEREMQLLQAGAREREERLLRDLSGLSERLRGEHEADQRRAKRESEAELKDLRDKLERSTADLERMRAVCGALERQLATRRAQLVQLAAARAGWEKAQERYKAEFLAFQRKWAEREQQLLAEPARAAAGGPAPEPGPCVEEEVQRRVAQAVAALEQAKARELEAASAALRRELGQEASARTEKLQADWDAERQALATELEQWRLAVAEEGRRRVSRAEEHLQAEREAAARARALQAEWDAARQALESEVARLREELRLTQAEWAERTAGQQAQAQDLTRQMEDLSSRLAAEAAARQAVAAKEEDMERLAAARAAALAHLQASFAHKKEGLERLAAAQAARLLQLEQAVARQNAEAESAVLSQQGWLPVLQGAIEELSREVSLGQAQVQAFSQASDSAAGKLAGMRRQVGEFQAFLGEAAEPE